MAIEQVKAWEIVKRAVGKVLDVPEFQREFVWDPEQVSLLAESMYRDYPVGSFLLWDSSDYQEAKTAQGSQESLWIVDGQQRTTALCLLLGEKPYWWDDSDTWNKALQRYDVMMSLDHGQEGRPQFALANPIRKQSPQWIHVRDVLSKDKTEALSPLCQDIARRIDPAADIDLFTHVHARLQRLWQVREREIPIIKVDHEVEDVAEIFARLNQAGTRVKEADVVLALAAAKNPGWVRNEYLPFVDDLESGGWDLEAGVFVRAMTGIGYGRARLLDVPKAFWSPDSLPKVWKRTSAVMAQVTKRLAEFGIASSALLPSTNALIPLFVLHDTWCNESDYDFRKVLYWFLLANRDGRYSGSATTALNEDVRGIKEAGSFHYALRVLLDRIQASPTVEPDEFLQRYDRAGSRFLRLALYLVVYHASGRDWVEQTRIGYDKSGPAIIAGFVPNWHHVFPKQLLRDVGVSLDEIHALANITVMNEETNCLKLRAKPPWKYIQQYAVPAEELQRHAIPKAWVDDISEETWSPAKYVDFLVDRSIELAHRVTSLLNELAAGAGFVSEPVPDHTVSPA